MCTRGSGNIICVRGQRFSSLDPVPYLKSIPLSLWLNSWPAALASACRAPFFFFFTWAVVVELDGPKQPLSQGQQLLLFFNKGQKKKKKNG